VYYNDRALSQSRGNAEVLGGEGRVCSADARVLLIPICFSCCFCVFIVEFHLCRSSFSYQYHVPFLRASSLSEAHAYGFLMKEESNGSGLKRGREGRQVVNEVDDEIVSLGKV